MNNKLNETQVFIEVRKYLLADGWVALGGQPPSGTDHLPVIEIRNPANTGKGSKGSYKPDLIAWKDGKLIIIELKPEFNKPDFDKVLEVLNSPERISSLWESLIQRNLSLGAHGKLADQRASTRLVGGLGYSGNQVEHPELWRFFVNNRSVQVVPGSFAREI